MSLPKAPEARTLKGDRQAMVYMPPESHLEQDVARGKAAAITVFGRMIGNRWLFVLLACATLAGCSTPNVNPVQARPGTGYVDFYTDNDQELCWEIKQAKGARGELKTVCCEYEPAKGNILRLASRPGEQRFQIWFNNQATEGPQPVQVTVEAGKVTPVRVTLKAASTATVSRKVYGFRPSYRGYGRGTRVATEQEEICRIEPEAGVAQAYQQKERMPYFSAPPK
jgi:hypothetical protein